MAEDKKAMDVSKPGSATPDIGSKPMIVGHKSMIDPMVKEETEATTAGSTAEAPAEGAAQAAPSVSKKVIAPVSEPKKEEEAPAESVPEKKEEKPTAEETVSKPEESAPKDKADPQKDTKDDKKTDKIDPAAEAMEREEKTRKLIESKKYFVDIKQARGSNKNTILILLAALVLGLGALFYLADTDKIDLGFDLPVNIFGEKEAIPDSTTTLPVETEELEAQDTEEDNSPQESEEVSTEITHDIDISGIVFPEAWGKKTKADWQNDTYEFSDVGLKVYFQPAEDGTRVQVAIGHISECEYNGEGDWTPVEVDDLGSSTPDKCPDSTRQAGSTSIYIFEKQALGAYGYVEIFEHDGLLIQISDGADYPEDFNTDLDEAQIKDGVIERVQESVKEATNELIELNQ